MSYLYNFYQGSLDDLADKLKGVSGHEQQVDAMMEAVDSSWTLVDPTIADILDWHDQEELLKQAAAVSPDVGDLVKRLMSSPPLDIQPFDFGLHGSLRASELSELLRLLEDSVSGSAARLASNRSLWDHDLSDRGDPASGPAAVLLGIRPADPKLDIITALGW